MTDICAVVRAVFWLIALTTLIAVEVILVRVAVMPSWGAWMIAAGAGGLCGLLAAEGFARCEGVRELYEQAPVNGATGVRISYAELLIPYGMTAFLVACFLGVANGRRLVNGLAPLALPGWLVYLPVIGILCVLLAGLWFRRTRSTR